MLDTIINVKTLKVYDGKTISDVAFNQNLPNRYMPLNIDFP